MGDGSGLARVRIQPSYPGPARLRGIEGEVIVEFTVTETGSVVSPRVIEANPPRVFDRAAMRAILKWKFRPKKVDGRPVAHTVRQIFTFRMEQG